MQRLADRLLPKNKNIVTLGLAVVLALVATTSKGSSLQESNAQTSTSPTLLFQDNFESGNTAAWDGVYRTGTSSAVQASKTAADAGAYGLDAIKSGKNDNGHALVYKGIPAPANNVLSLRTRMRIISRAGTGSMQFAALYRNAPLYQPIVAIRHNGTSYVLRLHRLDGSIQEVPLSTQLANGTWYDVELVYAWNSQRPVATAYLNGKQVASLTDVTQGTLYTPDNIFVGLYEDAWTQQAEAQWDDVNATNYVQSVGSSLQFSDGFETGNTSNWDGLATKGQSSTVRVSANAEYSGNFGLDTIKSGRNDNGESDVFKTLTAPSTHVASLRTRMRIVSRTGSGILQLQRLYVHAPVYQPIVSVAHNGSAYSLTLRQRNGGLAQKPLATQFANGTWYDVELVYDWSGAQPVASVYVNGSVAASMTDSTSGTFFAPDSTYLGLNETYWTQQAEVQWDNVSLADQLQSSASGIVIASSSAAPSSSVPASEQTPPLSPPPAAPAATATAAPQPTPVPSSPAPAPATGTNEWTQDGHDAQHTGATSEEPTEGWSYAWSWNGPDANGGSSYNTYRAPDQAHTVTGAGHLFAPAGTAGLYALNLTDGSVAWHITSPAFNATPAYDPATNALFAGGADGNLYKLNPTSGAILGTYAAGSALNTSVLLAGGAAFVTDANSNLHKVSTTTMARAWLYQSNCSAQCSVDTPPSYSPSRDAIIFAAGDLYVHAVNNTNGSLKWKNKPTPNPAQFPFQFGRGWPVIAEQHGLVFLRLQADANGLTSYPSTGNIYPNSNADVRSWLQANPTQQTLFALSLDSGASAFIPAVGYGSVDGLDANNNFYRLMPSQPVVKVWPNGDEVVYIQFRDGQTTPAPPDGRWDAHMGEMVLDSSTVPGLSPGDMRFVQMDRYGSQGGNAYTNIADEQYPLTLAGSSILYNSFTGMSSAAITNRADNLGLSYSSPITTTAHPTIIKRLQACGTFNAATHYANCNGLTLYNDGRFWDGSGFWMYWNVNDPGMTSAGWPAAARYGYVSDGLIIYQGEVGDLFVLHHK